MTNEPTKIGNYYLYSRSKIRDAKQLGGQDEELMLAYYDRRMGLIKDEKGNVVANGTFWDFETNQPKKSQKKSNATSSNE